MVIAVSVFPSSLSVPGFGRELAETIGVTDIVASGEVHLADGRSYLFAVPRPAERDATSWGVCVLEPVLLVQESRIVLRHADEWLAELREGSSEESDHLVIIRVGLTDETLEFVRMSERGGVTLPPRPVPLAVVPHGR